MTEIEPARPDSGRVFFSQPNGPRPKIGRVLVRLANIAAPITESKLWFLAAIVIGAVPLLVSFALGVRGHAIVSAILLSWLCLAFVSKDRWVTCIAAIALAFIAHSLLAVGLSRRAPEACAAILPQAADYWDQQHRWITTGVNQEYELSSWLPAHLQLFLGVAFFSFTSLGSVVFHDGFVQVDMMNFYNAQLSMVSQDPFRAVGFGWHLWSVMRGLGYLFVSYEMISLSYQFFSKDQIATRRIRSIRWGLGIGFLLADCVIKYFAVEAVRLRLFENLS